MQMTEREIRMSYATAKDQKKQIDILAQLNACSKEDIEKNIAASEKKVEQKRPGRPRKVAESSNPDAELKNISDFEVFVTNRMDELENQIKAMENEYKNLSAALLVIGQYKEMAT